MIPFDEALEIILSAAPSGAAAEITSIKQARGRVLAEEIISDVNIPPLDNSAMDGYALIHTDAASASKDNPAELEITGEIQAGGEFESVKVISGCAVRIMTGAPIPDGADSVVPVEDTAENNGRVKIFIPLKKNENIRFAGEDISVGTKILSPGGRLSSAHIGLLASVNRAEIKVFKTPSVAVISTGNEVVEVGADIAPGKIRNSNAYTLLSEIERCGARPVYLGIARDTIEDTMDKFTKGFECDAVISTGGVSMGQYDFVGEVMTRLKIDIKIKTILMKPGKPLIFGTKGDKLFFGLPGNPVSTMVSFEQFVRPAILKMSGEKNLKRPFVSAELLEDIKKKPGRRHFIRGIFSVRDGKFFVTTTGDQGSGILTSMASSNCLIVLPEDGSFFKTGSSVMIQLTRHEEIS